MVRRQSAFSVVRPKAMASFTEYCIIGGGVHVWYGQWISLNATWPVGFQFTPTIATGHLTIPADAQQPRPCTHSCCVCSGARIGPTVCDAWLPDCLNMCGPFDHNIRAYRDCTKSHFILRFASLFADFTDKLNPKVHTPNWPLANVSVEHHLFIRTDIFYYIVTLCCANAVPIGLSCLQCMPPHNFATTTLHTFTAIQYNIYFIGDTKQ